MLLLENRHTLEYEIEAPYVYFHLVAQNVKNVCTQDCVNKINNFYHFIKDKVQ